MYLYISIQTGGFNDILCTLYNIMPYCIRFKRTILLNGLNTLYKINFGNYFNYNTDFVITDTTKILDICQEDTSVYPPCLQGKLSSIINNEITFPYKGNKIFHYEHIALDLPKHNVSETILVCCRNYGGAFAYKIFKNLTMCSQVKLACIERYNQIPKPYICIQIRNTDHTSNYQELYKVNKDVIHSSHLFIATDDKHSLDFFKEKGLRVFNFTKFPEEGTPLHFSNVDPNDKITDLLCDIYLISMSETILSYSKGSFIHLVQECNRNRKNIQNQFAVV
jgi:hypothetical protein